MSDDKKIDELGSKLEWATPFIILNGPPHFGRQIFLDKINDLLFEDFPENDGHMKGQKDRVKFVSSVDYCKELVIDAAERFNKDDIIIKYMGYIKNKHKRYRNILTDIKRTFDKYFFNFSNQIVFDEYLKDYEYNVNPGEIFVTAIQEPYNIGKMKNYIKYMNKGELIFVNRARDFPPTPVITVYVDKDPLYSDVVTDSDRLSCDKNDYFYDYIIDNNTTKEKYENNITKFYNDVLKKYLV